MHSVLLFLLYLLSFLYFVLVVCFQLAASVFPAISAVLLIFAASALMEEWENKLEK
jgi:hypothetical protein